MSEKTKQPVLPPPPADQERHKNTASGMPSKRFFDDVVRISDDEIRESIMNECRKHRLWRGSVVKKMQFEYLQHTTCIEYVLESFTETRSTSEATEALSAGVLLERSEDILSGSSNPWDYQVFPKEMFLDQSRVLELPGSSRTAACVSCDSEGNMHCFHCRGQGTDKCGFCRGTGMKSGVAHPAVYTHPMVATFPHADLTRGYMSSNTTIMKKGNTAYGIGTPMHFMSKTGVPPPGIGTHDLCYMCHGRGVKECAQCKGVGKKLCSTCAGSGSTRSFTKLIVHFETDRSEYITPCDIPEHLIKKVQGKEIFSETQNYVYPITKYPVNDINDRSRMMCAKMLDKCAGKCRVIQQRHQLIAIPIVKVHYKLGSQSGVFWVYGKERRCYAPNYPAKCSIL